MSGTEKWGPSITTSRLNIKMAMGISLSINKKKKKKKKINKHSANTRYFQNPMQMLNQYQRQRHQSQILMGLPSAFSLSFSLSFSLPSMHASKHGCNSQSQLWSVFQWWNRRVERSSSFRVRVSIILVISWWTNSALRHAPRYHVLCKTESLLGEKEIIRVRSDIEHQLKRWSRRWFCCFSSRQQP